MQTATQGNQRSDRSTSEGGGRDKLRKVDGDFPTCMRLKKDSNNDYTRKNEDLKGRGGGRLKHYNVDGDVPLCLTKTEGKTRTAAAAIKRTTRKKAEW